jgi:tetratricopeptide (TPR) repeat protein/DNA-binding XRE family transcriptional regulator
MSDEGNSRHMPGEAGFLPKQKKRSGHPRPDRSMRLSIGEQVRIARTIADITQEALGKPEFSKSYISAIERGKIKPPIKTLLLLAKRLGVPVSYLLGENKITEQALEESKQVVSSSHPSKISKVEAWRRLSDAERLIRIDKPQEAWEALGKGEEPLEAWPLEQRPSWCWRAGWALILLGNPAAAVHHLEIGLQLAEHRRLRATLSEYASLDEMVERHLCFLGIAYCSLDKPALAFQYHRHGLEAIKQDRIRDPELKLLVCKGLGNECIAYALYDDAISYYQLALDFASNSDNKRQQGYAAWGLAVAYQQQGDLFRAKTSYEEALEALGRHGNLQLLAQLRAGFGLMLIHLQDYEEAANQLQKGLTSALKLGDNRIRGLVLAYFASLYLAQGKLDQAIQAAQEGLPLSQQCKDSRNVAHLHLVFASVYIARHDFVAAEQALLVAMQIGEESFDRDLFGQVCQDYAQFLADRGRFDEAYRLMLRLRSWHDGRPGSEQL